MITEIKLTRARLEQLLKAEQVLHLLEITGIVSENTLDTLEYQDDYPTEEWLDKQIVCEMI